MDKKSRPNIYVPSQWCRGGGGFYDLPLCLINMYLVRATFRTKTQLVYNFPFLTLRRHFKCLISNINLPILTKDYSTKTFFYFTKVKWVNCYSQVLCGNKYLFKTVYVIATDIQGTRNSKHSSLITMHQPISALKIPRCNATKTFSKSWSLTISLRVLLIHVISKNTAEHHIQVYNKFKKIVDRTGSPSYVCLYALFIWDGIYNCLYEHA